MTYGIGIVGAGMIAPFHLEAIKGLPNARAVGIMDHGSGKGRAIAPDLDTTGADDLENFLARDDVDIITIATPSGSHLDIALAAAAAGVHCIVEKPIEITLDRIDRMIAAHDAAGTLLGGIFNNRYTESAQLLKRTVEAGRFGTLTFAGTTGPWWRDPEYYSSSNWKGTWALDGGGALMNQGIHSVDQLQWLVGSPVTHVNGRIATIAHPTIEVEDTGAATLQFENGALGSIACTTSMWPGHFRTLTLAGTHGTAVLADEGLLFWQFREEIAEDQVTRNKMLALPGAGIGASNPSAGVDARGHMAVFADFLAALEAGATPVIDGHEARKAVAIIRAIYDSSVRDGVSLTP